MAQRKDETPAFHKQGWMEKQGNLPLSQWRRRWFVLHTDTLQYYARKEDATAIGQPIPLFNGCSVKEVTGVRGREHLLELTCTPLKRTFLLQPPTSSELAEWLFALERACASDGGEPKYNRYGFLLNSVEIIELYENWASQFDQNHEKRNWRRRFNSQLGYERDGYRELVWSTKLLVSPCADQIAKDVVRSLGGHRRAAALRLKLSRVLIAYSFRNPSMGYTQSLNFIAGLVIATASEETSFWVLSALVESLLPDYYTENLLGVIVDCRLLDNVLAKCLPNLHSSLRLRNIDLSQISTSWFMCVFSNALPTESALLVLESVLRDGRIALFRIAIAIFALAESTVESCLDPLDVPRAFGTWVSKCMDGDLLLRVAYDNKVFSLSDDVFAQMRSDAFEEWKEFEAQMQSEMGGGGGDGDNGRSMAGITSKLTARMGKLKTFAAKQTTRVQRVLKVDKLGIGGNGGAGSPTGGRRSVVTEVRDWTMYATGKSALRPQWEADGAHPNCCNLCKRNWSLLRGVRKHHCRGCGIVLCGFCCHKAEIPALGYDQEERVCRACWDFVTDGE